MNRDKLTAGTRRSLHLFPLAITLPGVAACFAGARISESYWSLLGLLTALTFACLLLGGLLGFLFGIPKLNRNYRPREDYNRSTKYMPNTNLEDLSDWLTKIIIGVTLTQLGNIPGYLQGVVDYLIGGSHVTFQGDLARPFLTALIIYALIAGLMTGYFYTRIYLPNLFSLMEENRKQKAEIARWREEVRKKEQTVCNHPDSEERPS